MKALQDRIEVGYKFEIKNAVEGVVKVLPDGTVVLDRVVTQIREGRSISTALMAAAGDLRTTVAIRNPDDLESVDATLLDGVMRGDRAAMRAMLNTPYAQKVMRGILGGSDQVL